MIRLLLRLIVLAVLALVAFTIWTDVAWGSPTWWTTPPSHLRDCGRTYDLSGTTAGRGRGIGEYPPLFGQEVVAVGGRAGACPAELGLRTTHRRADLYVPA